MKYRRTVISMIAVASLAGTAGIAQATHREPGYSPCRPAGTTDDVRAGYSDDGAQGDPRHELPTVYANGDPQGGDLTGNVGACGGGGDDGHSVEVGNDEDGAYYEAQGDPTTVVTLP